MNGNLALPAGWGHAPLKRLTRFGYGDALAADIRDPGGSVAVYGSNGPFDVHSAANTLSPCIIVGRKGSYGKCQFSEDNVYAVDTTFVIDKRHTNADLRYLFYLLGVLGLDELSDDTAVPGLSREKAYQFLAPAPPIETQKRIAVFLDEKTVQIDALIEKKRALLDRLAEKRQAIITQAVTKGLNPVVPMKDSGIDWLGQIPAHWEVRGLTKCTTRVDYRGATPEKSTSGVFLVTARNIKDGQIDYKLSEEFIPDEDYEYVMRRGKPIIGEVLFTTEAPLGEIANVDQIGVALAQRIIKLSSSMANLDNYYLALWMRSKKFQFDVLSRATGSTALGIKASKIVELRCLLPPMSEQQKIVSYVNSAQNAINAVQIKVEKSRDQLVEYRSALITAAVTGQIEGLR